MESHQKSVDLHSSLPRSLPIKSFKTKGSKSGNTAERNKRFSRPKGWAFSNTPWVPFHQELLKTFFTLLFLSIPMLLISEMNCWLPSNSIYCFYWIRLFKKYSQSIPKICLLSLITFICAQVKWLSALAILFITLTHFLKKIYMYFINRKDNMLEN